MWSGVCLCVSVCVCVCRCLSLSLPHSLTLCLPASRRQVLWTAKEHETPEFPWARRFALRTLPDNSLQARLPKYFIGLFERYAKSLVVLLLRHRQNSGSTSLLVDYISELAWRWGRFVFLGLRPFGRRRSTRRPSSPGPGALRSARCPTTLSRQSPRPASKLTGRWSCLVILERQGKSTPPPHLW